MTANKTEFLKEKLEGMAERGETWTIRNLDGPTKPHVSVEGKECIMLASNNYLNLANDPRLKQAAKEAIDKYGAGAGSDWSIAGSMKIHDELNKKIAEFKGTESAVIFQTGYAVNAGVLPQIIGKGDLVISDQLNHGSIIDGIRLAKAERAVYPHSNMSELEDLLKKSQGRYKRILIVNSLRRWLVLLGSPFAAHSSILLPTS